MCLFVAWWMCSFCYCWVCGFIVGCVFVIAGCVCSCFAPSFKDEFAENCACCQMRRKLKIKRAIASTLLTPGQLVPTLT